MNINDFPKDIQDHLIPEPQGELAYTCLGCGSEFGISHLLYVCPDCGHVLLLKDKKPERISGISGKQWRRIFDYRKMLTLPSLKGIYRYHEFIGPVVPLDSVVYLGEGHTPIVEANGALKDMAGVRFFFKNDGQNPSASFKDRGMASALSYINYLVREGLVNDVLAICASTGDTSASAALYAAYLQPHIKSAVILPSKKVTPQQLSQPLGNGAKVFEIPGVFDDCMKVVEDLSANYAVALLNSKNAWRILGQESYSYEVAQDFEYDMQSKVVVVPIGNAGNITAVMNGFIKFFEAGIIEVLPQIIGVQSNHANPVYKYYLEPDQSKRNFVPVNVRASVAQAAMIGNPVSMPRVINRVERYNALSGKKNVFFVEVSEQDIMDWELTANRNGHIACTQGGESLAGLVKAVEEGIVGPQATAVVDSTAHALKFSGFQDMYFKNSFPKEFEIDPKPSLMNHPRLVHPEDLATIPTPDKPLAGDELTSYVKRISSEIATLLNLKRIGD